MKVPILCLRVSRRALAAASISDETLGFHDGRHLSSNSTRAQRSARRYVERILEMTRPTTILIDAPHKDGSQASQILKAILAMSTEMAIPAVLLSTSDVLASFGIPGLRSRRELLSVVQQFWAELAGMSLKVKPFVVEAAAGALYADVQQALGVPAPG